MNKKTKIKQVETESIAYKGNVVVSVMLGNKVIKKYDVGLVCKQCSKVYGSR